MGKVNIVHVDESNPVAFPKLAGVSAQGELKTRGVFTTRDRPLLLWMHELAPGAQIRWKQPTVGHVVYVWKGSITANEEKLGPAGVVCIEHRGDAVIEAGESGATLLHYHNQEASSAKPSRAGGNVHVVGSNGILKVRNDEYDMTTTVWADSTCKSCELWLHLSQFGTPSPQDNPHFHTEDEIIFVVQGGMIVGRRILKPGTALAIDANTTYGFGVDQGGLAFTNFRPTDPHFVMMSRDGPLHAPISERETIGKDYRQVPGTAG